MLVNCLQQSSSKNYYTLTQTVIPRPIAWVLSNNGNGTFNLAPFSFFNVVSSDPAILMLSVGWKDEQTRKDTWVNIDARDHFVVHIPSVEHLVPMVASSATLAHGVSEVDQLGLSLEKVDGQPMPKLKGPKVAFFCEKYRIEEIGKDRQGMILGRINSIWIDDSVVKTNNGKTIIDPKAIDPLARLGGSNYAGLSELIIKQRPE